MSKSTIDVCISTMDHRIAGLVGVLPVIPAVRYLVGRQITSSAYEEMPAEWVAYQAGRDDIVVCRLFGTGLSKSRNDLIGLSSADILLFADDDVAFCDSFAETILSAYAAAPDAAAITFLMSTKAHRVVKMAAPVSHDYLSLMGVSSIEMTVARRKVLDSGVLFDESFGLGAKWPSGEEFIFLADMRRAGGEVLFQPKVIVAHDHPSSGPTYFLTDVGIRAKGAMFERVFGPWIGKVLSVLFAVKKYPQYRCMHSIGSFCRIMLTRGSEPG